MNQITPSKKSRYQKRPIVLTAFCVLYLFVFIWNLVELLIPSGFVTATIKLPTWYVIVELTVLNPVGIVSTLGIWFMRRWGVFVFFSLALLGWLLQIFGLNLLPQMKAFFIALVFFATCLTYLWQMK